MDKRRLVNFILIFGALSVSLSPSFADAISEAFKENIYQVGRLKPIDSVLTVKVGDQAPDFTLSSVSGEKITLSKIRSKKNVVLSFVPAAWTPVCSDQWPGYNIIKEIFDQNDATLLGITVDNIPTLFAWTNQMGKLWFPVLSDFWPHGKVAKSYGLLRSNGVSERALLIIDKRNHSIYRCARYQRETPSRGSCQRIEKVKKITIVKCQNPKFIICLPAGGWSFRLDLTSGLWNLSSAVAGVLILRFLVLMD
jgi:peroxiredoxin